MVRGERIEPDYLAELVAREDKGDEDASKEIENIKKRYDSLIKSYRAYPSPMRINLEGGFHVGGRTKSRPFLDDNR